MSYTVSLPALSPYPQLYHLFSAMRNILSYSDLASITGVPYRRTKQTTWLLDT